MKIVNPLLEWLGLLSVVALLGVFAFILAVVNAGWTLAKFAIAFHLFFGA